MVGPNSYSLSKGPGIGGILRVQVYPKTSYQPIAGLDFNPLHALHLGTLNLQGIGVWEIFVYKRRFG